MEIPPFAPLFESDQLQAAILEEDRIAKEQYHVRVTRSLMLSDGAWRGHPIAFPSTREDRIISVPRLSCCGESCYDAIRALFDQALARR